MDIGETTEVRTVTPLIQPGPRRTVREPERAPQRQPVPVEAPEREKVLVPAKVGIGPR